MSLLNDALRKNRLDAQPAHPVNNPSQLKTNRPDQRNHRRAILMAAGGVILAGGILAWYVYPTSKPNSDAFEAAVAIEQVQPVSEPLESSGSNTYPIPAAAEPDSPPSAPLAEKAAASKPTITDPILPVASIETEPPPPKPSVDSRSTPTSRGLKPKSTVRPPATSLPPRKAHPRPKVPPRPVVTHLYEKARDYHRQGRLKEAIAMYAETIRIDPHHFDARFNLVSAYLQTDAFHKAYPLALALHRQRPDNPEVMLNLALTCIGRDDAAKGLALLKQAEPKPGAPLFEIYLHQGVANRLLGKLPAAITAYGKAERIDPENPYLLFNLAMVHDRQQNYREAIQYYRHYMQVSNQAASANRQRIEQRINLLEATLSQPIVEKKDLQ